MATRAVRGCRVGDLAVGVVGVKVCLCFFLQVRNGPIGEGKDTR